jgi:hypothetical protein
MPFHELDRIAREVFERVNQRLIYLDADREVREARTLQELQEAYEAHHWWQVEARGRLRCAREAALTAWEYTGRSPAEVEERVVGAYDAVMAALNRPPSEVESEVWRWWHEVQDRYARAGEALLRMARMAKPADEPTTDPPAIWYHGGVSYSRDGRSPECVSTQCHNLLRQFLDRDEARTTAEIETAGVNNATVAAQRVIEQFGADRAHKSRLKGSGYFFRVRSLPGAK